MGSEDGGHQPPFSPIGIRHASTTQEDTTSGNVSDQERVTIVDSSPLVPPRNVQHLWRDVANLFDTQKQGTCSLEALSAMGSICCLINVQ